MRIARRSVFVSLNEGRAPSSTSFIWYVQGPFSATTNSRTRGEGCFQPFRVQIYTGDKESRNLSPFKCDFDRVCVHLKVTCSFGIFYPKER